MIESLWIVLLLVACRDVRARAQALVLATCWGASYWLAWMTPDSSLGYRGGTLIDLWGLIALLGLVIMDRLRHCWWALTVVGLMAGSVAAQVLFWRLSEHGLWYGPQMYTALMIIFTVQCLVLAWAGVRAARSKAPWRRHA